jgi:hypothetical protein
VILIGCGARGCREVWAGSPLADPLHALALADLDGDGQAELAALEGRYAEADGQPAWRLSCGAGKALGFQLRAAQEGRFGGLGAVRAVEGRWGWRFGRKMRRGGGFHERKGERMWTVGVCAGLLTALLACNLPLGGSPSRR